MNILKYILILILTLLIPAASFGQLGQRIVLSTGDTVRVVNQKSFLTPKDISFLRKDTLSRNKILNEKSDYCSIEEAALDLDHLMAEISTSQSLSKKNNESLSVRIATRNLRNMKKEEDVQNTWDNMVASEASVEELAELYKAFDDKPSYFVNGIMVQDQTVNKLRRNEILSRNIRTIDTATGNPNGEIWYEVIPQAIQRLNIEDKPTETPVETISEPSTSTLSEPSSEINSNSELKPHPRLTISKNTQPKKKEANSDKKRSVKKIKEARSQKYNITK